jgi:lipoprotein-releasing system permease protein
LDYTYFIARRMLSGRNAATATRPIVRIAIAGIAMGFCLMIITLSVVSGFKKEIREKVIGFGSHIQISNFDQNNSYETKPLPINPSFLDLLKQNPAIRHIQPFATKAGIIKTRENIEGVVLKGIDRHFDWSWFRDKIVTGTSLRLNDTAVSNDILLSKVTASRLGLKTGDAVVMYFIAQPVRARKFTVRGLYETGLEEFDKLYVLCDLGQIQKLNDWGKSQAGGFEVTVKDFDKLDQTAEQVYSSIGYDWNARSIKEIYPQIFDWLSLQDVNAAIIIALMIAVAGINMISALLIIILERVKMIGTLKALGADNRSVRKVFLYAAAFLIGRGLLIGNLAGLLLCWLQYRFHLVHLDQASYYIPYVPVRFNPGDLLLLNACTLLVCMVMMLLPTIQASRITPVRSLRFS